MRAAVVQRRRSTEQRDTLPLLCNDAASYVPSAWRVESCGHMQKQLVMLFFYNAASSYVLSVWRMSSCGHVQEQLGMLPPYNDAASYVCRRNETERNSL